MRRQAGHLEMGGRCAQMSRSSGGEGRGVEAAVDEKKETQAAKHDIRNMCAGATI